MPEKLKLNWKKLEHGTYPKNDKVVALYNCKSGFDGKHGPYIGKIQDYAYITHWADLPEIEPPEDGK